MDGGGREAAFVDDIFPLLITYTLQKSGTPFSTVPGMSFALNLLGQRQLNLDFATLSLKRNSVLKYQNNGV